MKIELRENATNHLVETFEDFKHILENNLSRNNGSHFVIGVEKERVGVKGEYSLWWFPVLKRKEGRVDFYMNKGPWSETLSIGNEREFKERLKDIQFHIVPTDKFKDFLLRN